MRIRKGVFKSIILYLQVSYLLKRHKLKCSMSQFKTFLLAGLCLSSLLKDHFFLLIIECFEKVGALSCQIK